MTAASEHLHQCDSECIPPCQNCPDCWATGVVICHTAECGGPCKLCRGTGKVRDE